MALLMSHTRTFRQSIPSIFTASKSTWPDPEQSIGRECSKISGFRCWEVTGPALEIINNLSIPIKEMLDNHQEILEQGELKPRAVSFHMWMIGSVASAANPTIVFSSKSRRQRTFAKVLLKESKLLDNYPGIRIKTLDKAPAVYQAADSNLDTDGEEISNDGIYMVDDSRGICGSLVAFGNSKLATMGGVILIDNVHYGISAQHARFNYTRERQRLTSEPVDAPCFDEDSDSEYGDLIEITSRGSISSASDHGYDTDSLTSAGVQADSIFEAPHASLGVDRLDREAEEMINTQQDRRFCGQRIADISTNYIQTDLDYELFRLDDPRFHTDNTISLPTMQESAQMLRPGKPARMPVDAAVWVVTGTTGFVRGTMTSTSHYIKMEGSRTFQEMWAVRLDRETRPGDCGAWVIDALTGSIYGHIIAGDPSSSIAYIIPAYKVFDDIEDRFGVPPRLPSETAPDPSQNYIIRSPEPTQNFTTASRSSAAAFNFDDCVHKVPLPRTRWEWPLMYSQQEFSHARRRVEFVSPTSPRIKEAECDLNILAIEALGDSSNRTANVEPSGAAAFGKTTWCHRSGTSGSQLLAFSTRKGYSEKAQILQNSYPRNPLVTERRKTRIPARALDTGVEPLRDSLFVVSPDYNKSYYAALSYEWGKPVIGTLSKDTENSNQTSTLWVDTICIDQRDRREVHAHVSRMDDIYASATRMKVLSGESAACSYTAIMASVHSVQEMILGYVEELESQRTTMRCNHPIQRVPLRLSSLPSSDSAGLGKSRWDFEIDFPDSLRDPCTRLDLLRSITYLESSDLEGTRFRARMNKAARLAYLASCLTELSGDPPRHLNEDAKMLTSRFDDLLRSRRLSEIRAAYGDSLGKLQQHRATRGNDYYRRLPTASMGKPNLHVISDQLSAILCHLEDFLKDRRDATTSSESLQIPLGYLVATPWHREERPVSHYNAAAHFEGILQSLTDGTDGKTAVKSLQILAIGSQGFWVDALDECQMPGFHHQISFKIFLYCLVFYIIPRQVPWRTSEWLRFFFWWENDSTLRSLEVERHEHEHDPYDS